MNSKQHPGCGSMRNKTIRIAALALAFLLSSALPVTAFAAQAPLSVPKEEVVYSTLRIDGQVEHTYVVNAFDLAAPATIVDYGAYGSVTNLTTTNTLSLKDGEVCINAPAGRFYYQGSMNAARLPWDIAIEYRLDGKPIKTTELAGASGHLSIALRIRAYPGVDPVFYNNYVLQTTVTLDTERCRNIAAQGAMIASAGANKVITYTKLPGEDADYVMTADVTDFEMEGIQFAGVPYSLEMKIPDTGAFKSDIVKLQDGIVELDDGVQSLTKGAGTLSSGARQFRDGMEDMQTGMLEFQDGFERLVGGNSELKDGSAKISEALFKIMNGLNQFTGASQDMTQLTQGSAQIAQGIRQFSEGMSALNGSFASADSGIQAATGTDSLHDANMQAVASLSALAGDPANAAIAPQLSLAIAALSADDQLIGGLRSGIDRESGLAAGAQALNTQYAQFDAGIQALPAAMNQLAFGMAELRSGITQLAWNYSSFHKGLVEYTEGTAELFDGYQTLCDGFFELVEGSSELASGTTRLHRGTKELSDGTGELKTKTSTMDTDMQNKIDEMMDAYTPQDFTPVSFSSPRNITIQSVQFVIKSAPIERNEQALAEPAERKTTFWQRLLALFTPKD